MAVVKLDVLRSVAFGSITNSYTALGGPLTQNWRMCRCLNNTDGDVFISDDGTNNKWFLPAGSFVLYDAAANALNVSDSDWFVFAIGTQFYVKYSTAPSKGSVYLEGVFSTGV